jgi:hypothetical protein
MQADRLEGGPSPSAPGAFSGGGRREGTLATAEDQALGIGRSGELRRREMGSQSGGYGDPAGSRGDLGATI